MAAALTALGFSLQKKVLWLIEFIYNIMFYVGLGRQQWVDGVGWVWMTTSELGKRSQLGLGFPWKKLCIIVHKINSTPFYGSKEEGMGGWLWMNSDVHFWSPYLMLDKQLLCVSQLRGPHIDFLTLKYIFPREELVLPWGCV